MWLFPCDSEVLEKTTTGLRCKSELSFPSSLNVRSKKCVQFATRVSHPNGCCSWLKSLICTWLSEQPAVVHLYPRLNFIPVSLEQNSLIPWQGRPPQRLMWTCLEVTFTMKTNKNKTCWLGLANGFAAHRRWFQAVVFGILSGIFTSECTGNNVRQFCSCMTWSGTSWTGRHDKSILVLYKFFLLKASSAVEVREICPVSLQQDARRPRSDLAG